MTRTFLASRTAVALTLVFFLAYGGPVRPAGQATEASAAWAGAVDKVFAEWDRTDSPGCAVALYKDGQSVYARGYGMADLEHDVPITPDTVFYVGSVSKQFTAMAAALAIKQGKVSLDDDVRKYLPELPDYGTPITVRHLIHHTSGLRDVNTLLAIAGRRDEDAFDNDAVLRIVSRQKALNFKPGDEHLYTNSGYALLALIVERATTTPFAQFADANIFTPLGMRVTHFHTDLSRLVKGRAYAYERAADGAIRLNTPQNERAGAGGVFASVSDLLKWDENFYDGRVGGMDVIRQARNTRPAERWHCPRVRLGPHRWSLPRPAHRRARRLTWRLPGARDPIPRLALLGGVSLQPRQHQSRRARAPRRRRLSGPSPRTRGAVRHALGRTPRRARAGVDAVGRSAVAIRRAVRERRTRDHLCAVRGRSSVEAAARRAAGVAHAATARG